MLESLTTEFRQTARGLRRTPAFTAAAVLTLAIGIGATTAVFGVVYGILYRPLPYPNAERLVQIVQVTEPTDRSPVPVRMGLTPNQFVDLQGTTTTLEAIGSYAYAPRTLTGVAVPARQSGAGVTPGLFAGLGVAPALGRMFVAEDGERPPLTDPVVILSHRTWVRYFGADPGIVDRRIALGDTRPLVIGVMPDGFSFPSLASASLAKDSGGDFENDPEFWLAMAPYQRTEAGPGFSAFISFAILKPGATPAQALADARTRLSALPNGRRASLELVPARREMAAEMGSVLTIFQLGVTLILLIACVNVANLLLSRAAHRRQDDAVRAALGASRAHVVRAHVIESALLGLLGGALGCLLAYAITTVVRTLPPHLLPRLREIRVDDVVLLFALALSIGTGLLVGLFSGLRAARSTLSSGVESLRGARSSPHRRLRPSGVLVIVEIAASMVLLTGAGLLINSFTRLMRVDPGMQAERTATFRVALTSNRYSSPAAQQEFVGTVLSALRAIPGVESAAASSFALDGGPIGFSDLRIGGVSSPREMRFRHVTPDYFGTLGTPLLSGREFRDSDRTAGALRVVVNDAFVKRHLAGGATVGTVIGYGERPSLEIVGVVADVRTTLAERPEPTLYLPPDDRSPFTIPAIVIRSSTALPLLLPAIRNAVRDADPQLAVYNAVTIDEMLEHSSASSRLYTWIAGWCAAIALMLAGIGLYGVLAYSVSMRTREFGIRMALGATSASVVMAVMRRGLVLGAAGVGGGLVASFYLSRFLEALLFDLTPHDAWTYGLAAAMFVSVALLACYLPTRRATRVNPVLALRAD